MAKKKTTTKKEEVKESKGSEKNKLIETLKTLFNQSGITITEEELTKISTLKDKEIEEYIDDLFPGRVPKTSNSVKKITDQEPYTKEECIKILNDSGKKMGFSIANIESLDVDELRKKVYKLEKNQLK